MSDSFTEVTRTSYGNRLKNAIGGSLVFNCYGNYAFAEKTIGGWIDELSPGKN